MQVWRASYHKTRILSRGPRTPQELAQDSKTLIKLYNANIILHFYIIRPIYSYINLDETCITSCI